MSQSKDQAIEWFVIPIFFAKAKLLLFRYYGSYLKGTGLWIIMEYCAGGSCSDLVCIYMNKRNA